MSDNHFNRRQVLSATGAAIIGSAVMSGSAAANDDHTYTADLSGEPLGVSTNAGGTATVSVADGEAHYELWVDCLRDGTHVTLSADGDVLAEYDLDSHGVVRDTVVLSGTESDEGLLDALEGEATITVHTEQNPDGEIEGSFSEAEEADPAPEEPAEEEEEEVDEEPEEEAPEEEEDEDDDEDDEEEEDGDGELSVSGTNVATGNDVSQESITFQNTGDGELDLSGWSVTDRADGGTGSVYNFSGFTLDAGAEVELITGEGSDTDDTVYWGLGAPRWNQDGDTIVVTDSSGNEVLAHEYGGGSPSIQFFLNQVRSLFA